MGSLGITEIVVIAFAAFLIFGPKRLPGIMRNLGKAVREFRNFRDRTVEEFNRESTAPEEKSSRETEP